jgi:hypothetical protein
VSRFDPVSFVAGVAVCGLGLLLLLDQLEEIQLGFAWATPAALAVLGAILLVSGVSGRR